jgi:hypothetical protein
MRLAGAVNYKSGRHGRILEADFALAPYPLGQLVGDLPDPAPAPIVRRGRPANTTTRTSGSRRPTTSAGSPGSGCRAAGSSAAPPPWHEDRHPSCSVDTDPSQGWCCHSASCGARGTIYDLASVLIGGPWGRELRGEAFARARARVIETFGEPR